MASGSSSKVETSSKDFFLTLKCPICLDFFNNPINFPSCAHTFCRECLKRIPSVDGHYECPVCRSRCVISRDHPLPTVSVISQMVDMVKNLEKDFEKRVSNENSETLNELDQDKCEHNTIPIDKVVCNHCRQSFCRKCRIVHAEKLKEGISVLTRDLNACNLACGVDLKTFYAGVRKSLDEKIELLEQEIVEGIDEILTEIRIQLLEMAKAKIAIANSLKFYQIGELEKIVNDSACRNELQSKLEQMKNQSILKTDLNEFADAYNVAERQRRDLVYLTEAKEKAKPDMRDIEFDLADFGRYIAKLMKRIESFEPEHLESHVELLERDDQERVIDTKVGIMTFLNRLKLEDCGIQRALGIHSLPGSEFFAVIDDQSYLNVFRASGVDLKFIVKLAMKGSDSPNLKLNGKIAFDNKFIYAIHATSTMIFRVKVPWNEILPACEADRPPTLFCDAECFVKISEPKKFTSIAIDSTRRRLYATTDSKEYLAFSTENPTQEAIAVNIASNGSILTCHCSFGLIFVDDDGDVSIENDGIHGSENYSSQYRYFCNRLYGLKMEEYLSGCITVDHSGIIYCADSKNDRVLVGKIKEEAEEEEEEDNDDDDDDNDDNVFVWESYASIRDVEKDENFEINPLAVAILQENALTFVKNCRVMAIINESSLYLLAIPASN